MLSEYRCPTCKKLLLKYRLNGSLILEVKCFRCKNTTTTAIENNERR